VTTLDGVLFFPVTPFDRHGELDLSALAEHVSQRLAAGPGGVFVACGTGEFHALDLAEYAQVVSAAVRATGGQVPVFAGAGGPVALARGQARAAQDAGADGLLLLPPYLVQAPGTGLVAYAASVAAASELPIIAYHRDNAQFDPATAAALARIPSVIGLKDGVGDLEVLGRIIVSVRAALTGTDKPFQFFNGMPTAEMSVPAYRGLGVELYSSAVFCFAPEISLAFYRAVTRGDDALRDRLLADFFAPLVALRRTTPGYAVSLVKAGVRLRGLDAGGVRPPLIDPSPEHVEQLQRILAAGLAVVG
jgi:5-dehydro-4-deoxyglucarate dehydratase